MESYTEAPSETLKKTDRRRRYTQSVIKEAFLALLRARPISKISVTEICKLADINRGTFYLHYLDPYDLLEKLEAQHSAVMIESISRTLLADESNQHIFNLSALIYKAIQADETLHLLISTQPSAYNIRQRLLTGLAPIIKPRLVSRGFTEVEASAVYVFLFSGYQAVDTYLREKKASEKEAKVAIDAVSAIVKKGLLVR